MKLKDTVALVTGAGRGIGKAIAITLATEGSTAVLVARTKSELESVRSEIEGRGGKAIALPADITKPEQVHLVFDEVSKQFGRLDILVNNAGIGRFAPVKELSLSDFDAMWNVNMRGLFLCTQQAVKMMEARKSGVIVNISSLAGKNAFVNGAGYAATKWALMGFAKCLMLEVREQNIRVVTVCPGSVDTTFSHPQDPSKAEKLIQPQDVADIVLAAITIPARSMVSEIDIRPTNPK
ncbi:MAG TPA: SDR family NAD(P)-dependent oxidoreductase [Bacteroidota bacterium]|nr:SDR family NAD(P)-dependent oxidoreductase [Bacteroidota bacterium]